MHFGVQNFDRQAVLDEAASLTQLTDATLLGMTGDERATSVNFEVETIDQYTFEAIEGDALTLTTTTPASGSGEFSNPLSPRISLFHDAGGSTAVALGTDAGDGRNEQISHTVPVGAGGTYRVVVSDGTDPGTYTLSIDGATGATPPLAVTDFSPAEGILLTSFPAGYQIDLSGNVLFTTIDADDLQITPPGGAATAPQNVTIVDGDTLAFDIANIAGADGTYGVQIAAGAFGGANGQPITEFTATYRVDATTPKVDSVIVNGTTGAGAVPNAGPTTIDIAFSEEIDSADLGPEDVSLQNTLISMGHIADTFTYDAPSSTLSLTFNDLPEGDYTLTLASGATAFRDLVGNLLDGNGDGTGGDDFTAAYTSDISVLPLPTPLEVVAPLGALVYDPPVTGLFQTAGDTDTFTIDLDAGDLASLAVTGAQGDALDMALLDADGSTLLALGLDALNVTSVIDGFIADAAGTYFARVSGTAGSDYNLVVTRNAQFERERNDTSQTAQDLVLRSGSTGQVLGGRQLSALQIEPDLFPPGTDLANAFGGATLAIVQFDGTTPAGFQVTSLTSSIASTGSHIFGSTSFNSTRRLRVDFDQLVSFASIDMITNDTSGDSGRLQAFDAADNLLGTDSRFRSGFGTAQTLTVGTATPLISYVIADAPSTDSLSFDNLVTSGDLADFYRLELSEADQIEAVTSTPGEGPNEPVNALDPRLTLVGPDGFVVAFDDNSADNVRNARFVYTVPVGGAGTHTLQLDGTGVGPCTILANRTGDPIAASAPTVVLAVPTDGTGVGTAPTTLRLGFSEGMRADSFDATDLVFADAGVSVNSVTQIDGDTVEFGVTVPDVEAVYDYTLTGGSATDLQGTGNAEFTGSFFIDRDGPQVVSTSPANQASAPFSEITFTFDENVDPASVDLSDAFNFAGPGGSITPGGVSVLGPDVIFTFPAQTTEGVYTFEIGPGITDVAGNLMDQDGNGTGGKVTDRFAVGLNLASPDLRPDDISPLAAAQFGATITVDYTARNVGTDSAANQWVDRICLSTDNVLGANDSYTRSEQGTIPLDATSQAGSYFVIVEVDADNQQAESIETNNTTLEPISLTLPPLPDLIVTDIVAPIESLSGQDIQIFWTLANQGTGDFSGSFNERLFLSADAFFSGNDQLFGTFDFTGNLPQGQSVNRTQTISLPDTLQGDRFVIIQTDSGAAVFEGQAGEQNNVTADDAAIQVSLRPFPNLQVTNMSPPAAAFSGQQIVIEWQVDNTGDGPTDVPTWNDGVFLSVDTRVLRTAHHRGVDRGQQRPDPDGRGLLA